MTTFAYEQFMQNDFVDVTIENFNNEKENNGKSLNQKSYLAIRNDVLCYCFVLI